MNQLQVKFVSIEDGISALGLRRVVAVARQLNPATDIYFITPGNLYSFSTHLFPSRAPSFGLKDIRVIARQLAKADLVCFSSMTPSASYVEKIASAIKKINSKTFILWGGTHCILNPNEAIRHVDAICTGEGEIPFRIFYQAFFHQKVYLSTPSMWFKTNAGIIKNKNLPLNNNKTLNSLPHPFWNLTCNIYDSRSKSFHTFTRNDYLKYNGLSYKTVWSIGCPFSCIYCANDAFICLDSNYRKIRYSSVEKLIKEIEIAIRIYPFISTIAFIDDNFIAIPQDVIKSFCKEYKKRIKLPFVVFGLHPNLVTRKKLELLGKAGMNRGRMGIQSGSPRILSFYNRPNPIKNIKKSTSIIADVSKKYHMIPAAYDIISDNPLETRKDIVTTLKFIYRLKRPYTLTIFSLRIFPKTKLYDYFKKHPSIDISYQTSSYLETRQTLNNILLYLLAFAKPPRFIFFWLLKRVKGYQEKQPTYPNLYFIVRTFYLISRGLAHLKKFDFSTIVGPWVYYVWKIGLAKSNPHFHKK